MTIAVGSLAALADPVEVARAQRITEQVARTQRILTQEERSEDYLMIPDEVRGAVDAEVARLWLEDGIETDTATQQELLADATLRHHFAGREVACARTPQGVIVFAVGSDEVNAVLAAIPPAQRRNVALEYP